MKKDIKAVNLLYLIDVILIILGFTILVMLMGLACLPFKGAGVDYEQVIGKFIELVNENQILAMVISQGLIGLPIVVFSINKKKLVSKVLRFNKLTSRTVVCIIVLTYTLLPVMTFVNMLSMVFVENKISSTINNIVGKQSIIVAITCVAMLPAIVEEILCRGIIYNVHSKVSIKKAVIMSGVLFGLLHCNFNQFAYAFFMGMIFALVVEATDSTLATVLMHFIINCNSLVLAYVSVHSGQKMSIDEEVNMTLQQVLSWGIFAIIALVISILVYVELAKSTNRLEHIKVELLSRNEDKNANNDVDNKEKSKITDAYLLIAMLVCVVYMICTEIM